MLVDQIARVVKEVKNTSLSVSPNDLKKFTDLAYIDENAEEQRLEAICLTAKTPPASAAVCVFPQHVKFCKDRLRGSDVKVAAVLNFPLGDGDSKEVRRQIDEAILLGSHEIDIVFPYQKYLDAKATAYTMFEKIFEHIAKRAFTKVIIETGALQDNVLIYDLSCGLIDMGVDMIKTSTGKHAQGPTLEAAAAILFAIKNHGVGAATGLKVSGGIKTCQDAAPYARLYQRIINRDWRNRSRLRFGASQLITS